MIISYAVPEIWHIKDVTIIFYFRLSFALLPPYQPEKSKFKKTKIKIMLGDIIILQWCIKNHVHMLYYPWDIAHNICNCYFSIWAIFWQFTSLKAWKTKIKEKKEKKSWRYHHFAMVYQKSWSCTILFLRYGGWEM